MGDLGLRRGVEELRQERERNEVGSQEVEALRGQLGQLQGELASRDLELQKNKKLNHELSVEFDKSVNKIVEF